MAIRRRAVVATLHDIVLTIGFFVVMQLTFDMTSIAVILTSSATR